MDNTVIQYHYEMPLSHREFLRIFSQVFPQGGYIYRNNQLAIECGMQRMVVSLAPSTESQNPASPITHVTFEFFCATPEIANEWMQRIMRYFQDCEAKLLS